MMTLRQMKSATLRHLAVRNYAAYEQALKAIKARGDIWITSQGEYVLWWRERQDASMRVIVSDALCRVESPLKDAVFEAYPGRILSPPAAGHCVSVPCKEAEFAGEVRLTIDNTLKRKDLLIELLKREGILNYHVAREGEFLLSRDELGPLLEAIETKLRERSRLFESDISIIRQLIADKLAARGLPLIRVWYHPRVNGRIVKAVFSPRYDVDRAITNVARIRKLEQKHEVTSTLYLRAFCPFYSDKDIRALASSDWCTEIGLHGEFVRNARRYGSELAAARAEKEHLESLIGRPVLGLCMHGGELTPNVSRETLETVERAGFLYDTTTRMSYYLPYRPIVDGQMGHTFLLNHAYGDIKVPPGRNYGHEFYRRVLERMDQVCQQNGIFVLTLHPVYFGFFSYLTRPKNMAILARFLIQLKKRIYND